MATTLATKVEQFIKLRDYKGAAKKEFDKSMQRINMAIEKLEGEILEGLNKEGLKNIKTQVGVAYKKTDSSATVKDRDKFEAWADANGHRGAMDIRANKKAIRELLEAGTVDEVPGVKYSETVTIGVRRN